MNLGTDDDPDFVAADDEAVAAALALRVIFPNAPALEILDRAMQRRRETLYNFHVGHRDQTLPDTAFARILRDAFAPDITDNDLNRLSNDKMVNGRTDVALQHLWTEWGNVWQALADRYKLWKDDAYNCTSSSMRPDRTRNS